MNAREVRAKKRTKILAGVEVLDYVRMAEEGFHCVGPDNTVNATYEASEPKQCDQCGAPHRVTRCKYCGS